ncbi:S8 family peptidase [Clostridium sp. OS1-26]|uniref:S8 family peptidase n=1 Tax=Clostridium sp. OS1-26 TaxID=3070681 RepID=UPI0027E0B8C1|nr:S8 family peptidase [Clostridium sp. OS1-26]WML34220.1 S8 family peptidase [Clostridium sp. OS1-26]
MKPTKIIVLAALSVLIVGTEFLTSESKIVTSNISSTSNKEIVQALHNKATPNSIYSKNYKVILPGYNSRQLQDKQTKGKTVKRIQLPQPVGIVTPIGKTPVNRNATVTDITLNTDTPVNDPGYKYEWAITATEANKAWTLVNQKRQVKVAVLDTGVDYTHVDLKNRVLTDLGYNFIDNSKNVLDDNGHGTHISGIIAAEANNKQGIVGIAGTLDVKIIPVKVLDKNGEGDSDKIAKGIIYAADKGADIINLSFGTKGTCEEIDSAIKYAKEKGAFVVVAAGNDNSNADLYTPAGDEQDAYTVSAITRQYKKANFSNYGSSIDIAAPGVKIISTVPNGYAAWDGTSMAAPVVSGVAALVKAENPNLTPDQIAEILDDTATDILSKGKDLQSGYGIVNAYKAVLKAKSAS